MRRLSALVLLALLTASTPAAAGLAMEGGAQANDLAASWRVAASGEGASASARVGDATALGDVRSECLPDWESQCDTYVQCDEQVPPTSCWTTRRPRPAWGCWYTEEGWLRCEEADEPPRSH